MCRIFRLLLLPGGEVFSVVGFASVRELAVLLSVALVDGLAVGVDVELLPGVSLKAGVVAAPEQMATAARQLKIDASVFTVLSQRRRLPALLESLSTRGWAPVEEELHVHDYLVRMIRSTSKPVRYMKKQKVRTK